jgi:hypothetical protein
MLAIGAASAGVFGPENRRNLSGDASETRKDVLFNPSMDGRLMKSALYTKTTPFYPIDECDLDVRTR